MWTRGPQSVGIEVKSGDTWRSKAGDALKVLVHTKAINRAFGVYLGETMLKDGPIAVLPVIEFLKRLDRGEIVG